MRRPDPRPRPAHQPHPRHHARPTGHGRADHQPQPADHPARQTPRPPGRDHRPSLVSLLGIGTDVAGQLLVTAGDNPERLHSEAAFAKLCGVAPLPASSGRTDRHRLNKGGERQANRVLHVAVVVRLRYCPRTHAYLQRRTEQGLTKRDIIRCLKRYVLREAHTAIMKDLAATA
ncbi:transposase [Lentzea indica]|uniref:transposase n=1 Tax=Lentzea indica TaxID=2604800 RepID=UPI00406BD239